MSYLGFMVLECRQTLQWVHQVDGVQLRGYLKIGVERIDVS